ncbi:MAG: MarR family transcriptional regulator [Actinomycetes bacterium]
MDGWTEVERAAWGGFLRAFATLDQAIDADLREHDGLRHSEFEVLLRLRMTPEQRLRIQELAQVSLLTRSGTSRLVDRLDRVGLLSREPDPRDGRVQYAVLTDAGRETFDRIRDRHITFVRERFHSRLSDEEIAVLAQVWAKLNGPNPARRSGT